MNKTAFAGIIVVLVGFVGCNRLPTDLKGQIVAQQETLERAKADISRERDQVEKDASVDPELFRVRSFDTQWRGRFAHVASNLSEAERAAASLEELKKRNSRSTKGEVEDLLRRENARINDATTEAASVQQEAERRVHFKQNLAQNLKDMEARAASAKGSDLASVTQTVEKAERDWPAKRDDLATRLTAIRAPVEEAEKSYEAIAPLRARAASGNLTSDDYAKLLDADSALTDLHTTDEARHLEDLSGQLYTSYDKLLEDLDKDDGEYREKIKTVTTRIPAPGGAGQTTSQEAWVVVPRSSWSSMEDNLGMTVEHKSVGLYDSEAERTPQPPGYAYMASPEQGRNQYGYWEHRDGGSFWTWLPEYLIMRDLLWGHYYQPIPIFEYHRYYEARQYGRPYYGTTITGEPKFGSHGTFTQQHYSASRYVQSGGFGSSKYASGAHSSSTPSASSSKSYGSGGHTFGGKPSGSSGRSFGSGSRSSGRSFGGRRR